MRLPITVAIRELTRPKKSLTNPQPRTLCMHSLQVLYSFGLSSHQRNRVDGLGSSLGYVLDPLARDESHFGPRAILIKDVTNG
jgi:hypothetical protein